VQLTIQSVIDLYSKGHETLGWSRKNCKNFNTAYQIIEGSVQPFHIKVNEFTHMFVLFKVIKIRLQVLCSC